MGYFTKTLRPTLPVATMINSNASDLAFRAQDLMWDWFAFDLPQPACRLVSATMLVRGEDGLPQTDRDMQLFFAKSDADGTAPTSMGTGNASVDGYGYYNNLLAHITVDIAEFAIGLDYMSMATGGMGGEDAVKTGGRNLVLQGEPNSGTNVGYDKLYVAGFCGGAIDFSTGVLSTGAISADTQTTIAVDTVDARKAFQKGDKVYIHDLDTLCGTVASVASGVITLEANNVVAIANNDEIINGSPMRLSLGFSR